jgi:hypothetical protein
VKKQLLLILPAAAIAGLVIAQGPLAPPGAPAPVMKTLDQIEPRTPVSSLPFTISQSGSYYFTGNLQFTAASGHAITITASDVTLDLMGFTLTSSAEVTGDAVRIAVGMHNIVVRNGTITGNSTVTVTGNAPNQTWVVTPAGFTNGIYNVPQPVAAGCHFSQLRVSRCRTYGLAGGEQALVDQVVATQNGADGISLNGQSSVTHCTSILNGATGIYNQNGSIANCVVNNNKGTGIIGQSVANTNVHGNGNNGISADCVTNCACDYNGTDGVFASQATVSNTRAISNGRHGIYAYGSGSITNCTASSNGGRGINGNYSSVSGCLASGNTGDGIFTTSGSVTNCTAISNGDNGISAANSVLAYCKASSNNTNNSGSTNIDATGAIRTGNSPAP